jgi:hypothetical protein
MKVAPMFEEQFHRKQDSQQQLHLSPPILKELTFEDISPDWASRLREKNKPLFCHYLGCDGVLHSKLLPNALYVKHMVIPINMWITVINARVSVPNFYITSH